MKNYEIILEQLGGNKFLTMTGCHHLIGDEGKALLRMQIPKNFSKANRLEIQLNSSDLYNMRFYKYQAPRLRSKTATFSDEKITEIAFYENIYGDMLEPIFAEVTHMYTRL